MHNQGPLFASKLLPTVLNPEAVSDPPLLAHQAEGRAVLGVGKVKEVACSSQVLHGLLLGTSQPWWAGMGREDACLQVSEEDWKKRVQFGLTKLRDGSC